MVHLGLVCKAHRLLYHSTLGLCVCVCLPARAPARSARAPAASQFYNLLVRIHFIIVMIRWTGLAPWVFEFPFPGSLTSTFLVLWKRRFAGESASPIRQSACGQEGKVTGVPR